MGQGQGAGTQMIGLSKDCKIHLALQKYSVIHTSKLIVQKLYAHVQCDEIRCTTNYSGNYLLEKQQCCPQRIQKQQHKANVDVVQERLPSHSAFLVCKRLIVSIELIKNIT